MNPRVHRSRVTQDRWLVSYADFITLLFAFFVVLYAFAKADQKKQMEVSASIDSGFKSLGLFSQMQGVPGKNSTDPGVLGASDFPISVRRGEDVRSAARIRDNLDAMRRELERALSTQVARHTVSIQMGRDGLVISLREAGFFNSGSATPRPETLDTLRTIAASVGRTAYEVRIEGHTDNVPMHNEVFDSNWELSSARATRIARLFLELHAIEPERLSAAGYAEYHPVASNETEAGRAENRRVDLVILPRSSVDFAAIDSANHKSAWARITDDK
ncbi:MAG: flagellar motor protein MotB [Terracidiphilus sp.]